jgi:hypothetical protein
VTCRVAPNGISTAGAPCPPSVVAVFSELDIQVEARDVFRMIDETLQITEITKRLLHSLGEFSFSEIIRDAKRRYGF